MQTCNIPWQGGVLPLLEVGSGPGTIALLHASLGTPRGLVPLARYLADGGWRVLVPSLPGYPPGASLPGPALAEGARDFVAALWHHADASGLPGPRVLAGHSMGGLVALTAARAGVAHDALVLYEPVAFGVLDPADPADAAADAWDGDLAALALADLAAGRPESGVARFVSAWGEAAWSALPESVRRALLAQAPVLARDIAFVRGDRAPAAAYAALTARTLVLAGDRSPEAARRIGRRLAAHISSAVLCEVTGAGHMGPVATPAPVADAILAFLADVSSGSARREVR